MELNFAARGCRKTGGGKPSDLPQKFFQSFFVFGGNWFNGSLLCGSWFYRSLFNQSWFNRVRFNDSIRAGRFRAGG